MLNKIFDSDFDSDSRRHIMTRETIRGITKIRTIDKIKLITT